MISLDTLRADRLGCYGYSRDTSPNIDALAAESFVFTNAYSNSNWTLPAHISMFTSLYPAQHQISLHVWRDEKFNPYDPVPYYYIPEAFKQANYLTIAFTGGGFVDSKYGFNKGFDYHTENIKALNIESIDAITATLNSLSNIPFFAFFHTYEIHDYFLEKSSHSRYVQEHFSIGEIPLAKIINFFKNPAVSMSKYKIFRDQLLSPEGIQYVNDLYDGAIFYTDELLGKFLDGLKTMNIYDTSWIILTSGHGEGFGESHNRNRTTSWSHGTSLYNDQTHIPLLIKPPKNYLPESPGGSIVTTFVELVDIPSTISSILGIEAHEQFRGQNLHRLLTSADNLSPEMIFSEEINLTKQFAVIKNQYKLIPTTTLKHLEEFLDIYRIIICCCQ